MIYYILYIIYYTLYIYDYDDDDDDDDHEFARAVCWPGRGDGKEVEAGRADLRTSFHSGPVQGHKDARLSYKYRLRENSELRMNTKLSLLWDVAAVSWPRVCSLQVLDELDLTKKEHVSWTWC